MARRLGARDQDKLDQYLTGVRDIEVRIQRTERFGEVRDPGVETPPAIPGHNGEYLQLMYDMLVLAFQTDSTRVATFLLAHDGSNRSFPEIGIPEGHHDLSHHLNEVDRIQKVAEIDRWYVGQFAAFLEKLRERTDAGRQLPPPQLDDCLWQRQRGRQPAHALQPAADPGGGRWGHARARSLRRSWL